MALAGDVGLCRFPLRIKAVELLLQPLRGGLARVHGAPHGAGFVHLPVARLPDALAPESPKNTKPFQWLPVISRAMADSDR